MTTRLRLEVPGVLTPLVLTFSRWRHRVRQTDYTTLLQGTMVGKTPVVEGDTLLAYVDQKSGRVWFRKHEEFHDGRFEGLDD